jgi:hypothetical protein
MMNYQYTYNSPTREGLLFLAMISGLPLEDETLCDHSPHLIRYLPPIKALTLKLTEDSSRSETN